MPFKNQDQDGWQRQPSPNLLNPQFPFPAMIARTIARLLIFLPALALAHPGHYHPPGEEDEFDQLRADYLHLHGPLEIGLAAVALGAVLLFKLNPNRKVRLAAACAFGGSLALIAAF
jgi:hypothetical protein